MRKIFVILFAILFAFYSISVVESHRSGERNGTSNGNRTTAIPIATTIRSKRAILDTLNCNGNATNSD
ncbi:hypothetical protein PVAND_012617 [Polypedilum vanderplanki]|uniref:Secreted protein n=1 Tax=Polypedilum vanderplanki TaxID=319348 RepID=A0A9J6CNW7_POLVA|nr:hypothetical protein PVAND_012617 [Polypedilum vanderplanki]